MKRYNGSLSIPAAPRQRGKENKSVFILICYVLLAFE